MPVLLALLHLRDAKTCSDTDFRSPGEYMRLSWNEIGARAAGFAEEIA
jgi:hypothetical protein